MKLKIISDGTNTGTKLIDEDTGQVVSLIQKLTWECDATDVVTKVSIDLLNIPVEIVAKADVDLLELKPDNQYTKPFLTKTFEKEIKIVSEDKGSNSFVPFVKIYDNVTGDPVGAIQEVKWEATPRGSRAQVRKIKFDNKDW